MFMGHQTIQLNHKQQITKHRLRKTKNYSSFSLKGYEKRMSTNDISIIKTNWGSKTIYVFYSYVSSNRKIFSYNKWLKSSEILLSRDIEVRILYSTCLHLSSLSFKQKIWELRRQDMKLNIKLWRECTSQSCHCG